MYFFICLYDNDRESLNKKFRNELSFIQHVFLIHSQINWDVFIYLNKTIYATHSRELKNGKDNCIYDLGTPHFRCRTPLDLLNRF